MGFLFLLPLHFNQNKQMQKDKEKQWLCLVAAVGTARNRRTGFQRYYESNSWRRMGLITISILMAPWYDVSLFFLPNNVSRKDNPRRKIRTKKNGELLNQNRFIKQHILVLSH